MLTSDDPVWVWVAAWGLLGAPIAWYWCYRSWAGDHWEAGEDVPTAAKVASALLAIPALAIGVLGAFIISAIAAYGVVPAVLAIALLFPAIDGDDLRVFAELVLFGSPVAVAYALTAEKRMADVRTGYVPSPSQRRKALDRMRRRNPLG